MEFRAEPGASEDNREPNGECRGASGWLAEDSSRDGIRRFAAARAAARDVIHDNDNWDNSRDSICRVRKRVMRDFSGLSRRGAKARASAPADDYASRRSGGANITGRTARRAAG